jgi:hypothetical protein
LPRTAELSQRLGRLAGPAFKLQRVGIQPHVVVRPTLAGLRAGRDAVLERALELLRSGR